MKSSLPGNRPQSVLFYLDNMVIATSFVLWTLPILFGHRNDWGLRSALLLPATAILLVKLLVLRHRLDFGADRIAGSLVLAFSAIWLVAMLRTAFSVLNIDTLYILGYLSFLLVASVYYLLAYSHFGGDEWRASVLRTSAALSLGTYVVFNVAAFLLGLRQPDRFYLTSYPAQVLALFGIDWNRTLFPIADGISSFGVISGATMLVFVPVLRAAVSSWQKAAAWIVVVSCVLAVAMTDSRGAMLFSAAGIALYFLPKPLFRYARWLPILVSILPILAMVLAPFGFQDIQWFTRPAGQMDAEQKAALSVELCTGNVIPQGGVLSNRPLVWAVVLGKLQHFEIAHLVGYGFRGQVFSGVSQQIACIFLSYVNRHLVSAHNVWLQVILDIGYLGMVVTGGLAIWLIKHFSDLAGRTGDGLHAGMLLSVSFIVMVGALEATLTPDYNGTFILFLNIAAVGLAASRQNSER